MISETTYVCHPNCFLDVQRTEVNDTEVTFKLEKKNENAMAKKKRPIDKVQNYKHNLENKRLNNNFSLI